MTWQIRDKNAQAYGFTYDDLNRLKSATHAEIYHSGAYYFNDNYHLTIGPYDANGNIMSLTRNGPALPNFDCGVQIDNLNMTHNGNQLLTVSDATTNATNRLRGFKAANSLPLVYMYDNNGNLTNDPHKGLTINYNHLNLPDNFDFGSGNNIAILYDAEGKKLRKTVTGSEANIKDYCEGIEYSGQALEAIYNEEGRVVRVGNAWEFQYALRDHLGSTRVLFRPVLNAQNQIEPQIIQQNHHYPFGGEMEGKWQQTQATVSQDYKYNNKEQSSEYGLEWMDFGNRWYLDGWLPVFSGVDPIGEDFSHLSLYNYAENNPIANIDLWGLQAVFSADGKLIGYSVQKGQGPTQIAKDLNENHANKINGKVEYTDIVYGNLSKFENVVQGDGKVLMPIILTLNQAIFNQEII